MIRRTIEVASPARLSVEHRQLLVQNDQGSHPVPFEDIGFLILDHPAIVCTQAVFRQCAEHDVALIATDEQHLPAALMLSLQPHSQQGRITRQQVNISEPLKRKLWQQMVNAKIQAQATALQHCHSEQHPKLTRLQHLAKPLKTQDDPVAREAQAARVYFKALFGKAFKRDTQLGGLNTLLNYGYIVVRTACARALMGAGLNPIFGLQHHNQYNAFCLADDFMEPLRPMVDCVVFAEYQQNPKVSLERAQKTALLSLLSQPVGINQRRQPFMTALGTYAASLRDCYGETRKTLNIPVAVNGKASL